MSASLPSRPVPGGAGKGGNNNIGSSNATIHSSHHKMSIPFFRHMGARMSMKSDSASSSDSDEEREFDIRQARCEVHRRKIGLKINKRLNISKQDELIEFIRKTFTMKECTRYVANMEASKKNLTAAPKCHCGATMDEHYRAPMGGDASNRSPQSSRSGSELGTMTSLNAQNIVLTPRVTQELLEQRKSRDSSKKNTIFPIRKEASPDRPGQSLESVRGALPPKLPPLAIRRDSIKYGERRPVNIRDSATSVQDTGTSIGSPSGSPKGRNAKDKLMKWDEESAFSTLQTNAFGKVEFANDEARSKPAKYVRLSDDTPMKSVVTMLIKMRMMDPHRPSLAISVIGGAKNFSLDGKKKEIFNRGLVKASQATNAWIITSGSYLGVMKAVGEAVRDGQSMQMAGHSRVTHSLRCIGVGSWGYVQNREDLISLDGRGSWPATYHVDPVMRHGKPASLDPNHTHFILVDDGHRNSFRPRVADFRARLERHIAAPSLTEPGREENEGGLGIPVVVVLVEGGIDSLEFAYESLKCRVPLVVCQGTGRAADILSYAYNNHIREIDEHGTRGPRILPDAQKSILMEKLKAAYGKTIKSSSRLQNEKLESKLDLITKCCQEEDLITVFDINRDEDLDLAILSALLKGRGASRLDQLRLSLKWNRPDVAEEKIFTDSAVWQYGELDDIMTEALAHNRSAFVKLLLQHGVVMKDYLTVRRLRILYNHAGRGSFLRRMLMSVSAGQPRFLLNHVKSVLEKLLERNVEDVYSLDIDEEGKIMANDQLMSTQQFDAFFSPISEARFQKPFKELFLWAVLMNRHGLARFFWERGDSPVIGALVATKLYKSLSRLVEGQNSDMGKAFCDYKDEFEDLAIHVVEHAFEFDPEKALLVVEKPQEHWGKTTCLAMAAAANDKRFLSTPCSQTSIDQIWKRGLNCSGFEIVAGILCPLFIIFRIKFDPFSLGVRGEELKWYQKLSIFYHSPITKFCSFTIFYLLFLSLYAYVVLFDLRTPISLTEIVLDGWVASLIVSGIRDYIWTYYKIPKEHRSKKVLWRHFSTSNIWTKTEVMAHAFHIAASLSRFLPLSYFDVTRSVYSLAVICYYLRLFRVYMASSYLGPKLFVIHQMVKDVMMFMLILIVFMMSYAIGSQALLYPRRDFYWGIFTDILYHPYWQMYGELSLDETVGGNRGGCEGNVTMNSQGQFCPRKFWPAPILLAVYLLIVNILLVNLLIAVFSHVFEEVQANSMEIWKFELYFLAAEFDYKATLPPPLSLFETLYQTIKVLFTCGKNSNTHSNIPLTNKQQENLQIFEKECMNEYLRKKEDKKRTDQSNRIRIIQERIESMYKKTDDDRTKNLQMEALMHFTRGGAGGPASNNNILNTRPLSDTTEMAIGKFQKPITMKTAESQVYDSDFNPSTLLDGNRPLKAKFKFVSKVKLAMRTRGGSKFRPSSSASKHSMRNHRSVSFQSSADGETAAADEQLRQLQQRLQSLESKAKNLPEVDS